MQINCDYLVIGSGLAGMVFALEAAESGHVIMITKRRMMDASTNYAQGGIAAVIDRGDSFQEHIRDTMVAGAGLCKEDVVRMTVESAPDAVRRLVDLGVEFSRSEENVGEFDLGREGGHSKRRVMHVGDFTGNAFQEALVKKVIKHPNITVYENHVAVDLIMKHKITGERRDRVCLGAYVLDAQSGEVFTFASSLTLLASGGAGKVYLYTSNPDIATGDGVAMAARAGARISNMEFYQFHPTVLYHPQETSFLISEALRGEGGILRRIDGTDFMKQYHPMASLAPRDVVARAIDQELKAHGERYVLLDMSSCAPDFIENRFPNIYKHCKDLGLDIRHEPIPVVPAAHYSCGGVATDMNGCTSIERLYAAGEVACTGLHGANRLASNSLLEAIVFGYRAAVDAKKLYCNAGRQKMIESVPIWDTGRAIPSDEVVIVTQTWEEIRRFMWNFVGIARSDHRLERAYSRISLVRSEIEKYYWKYNLTRDFVELRNIALVSDLIIRSAMLRKESRGIHYNVDYPYTDDRNYCADTVI